MRPRSKKRARSDRAAKSTLADFAEEFPFCWCCGAFDCSRRNGEYVWVDTHHVAGRVGTWRDDRRNLFRCCRECHETRWTNPTDGLSPLDRLAQQLAYKAVYDREFYDRSFVLKAKGYAETAISEADVGVLVGLVKENSDG